MWPPQVAFRAKGLTTRRGSFLQRVTVLRRGSFPEANMMGGSSTQPPNGMPIKKCHACNLYPTEVPTAAGNILGFPLH